MESKRPLTCWQVHFIFIAFHVFPLCFIKLSLLFLYRRIFHGTIFNITTWVLIGLTIAWTLSFFLALLLQCVPVTISTVTGSKSASSHCIDQIPVTFAVTSSGTVMDFLILLVPIPNVWKLQMPLRNKLALVGIFAIGFLYVLDSLY